MPRIFKPINQIKLTNVAVVRLKKAGMRFEIAAYKNKVLSWRNGIEKDIDEVLQTHTVFTNVSKGQAAKKEELLKAFNKTDETEICKDILMKGELQVSDKERQAAIDTQLANVAANVSTLCVDPQSRRPYPIPVIEKGLREAGFSLKANKNIKQNTLDAIKMLKNYMPLERSRMKVRITLQRGKEFPSHAKAELMELAAVVETEEWQEAKHVLVLQIDPGNYRLINDLVMKESKGKALVEFLELKELIESEEL